MYLIHTYIDDLCYIYKCYRSSVKIFQRSRAHFSKNIKLRFWICCVYFHLYNFSQRWGNFFLQKRDMCTCNYARVKNFSDFLRYTVPSLKLLSTNIVYIYIYIDSYISFHSICHGQLFHGVSSTCIRFIILYAVSVFR